MLLLFVLHSEVDQQKKKKWVCVWRATAAFLRLFPVSQWWNWNWNRNITTEDARRKTASLHHIGISAWNLHLFLFYFLDFEHLRSIVVNFGTLTLGDLWYLRLRTSLKPSVFGNCCGFAQESDEPDEDSWPRRVWNMFFCLYDCIILCSTWTFNVRTMPSVEIKRLHSSSREPFIKIQSHVYMHQLRSCGSFIWAILQELFNK